jgi:hypothetical protein
VQVDEQVKTTQKTQTGGGGFVAKIVEKVESFVNEVVATIEKGEIMPMAIAQNTPPQNESLYDRIRRLNAPLTEFCHWQYQAAL